MTENQIYKKLCTMRGFYWQRIESANTGSGIPDLSCCTQGYEFWVELKTGKIPRLRAAQVAWHTRARAQGRLAFILTAFGDYSYELYRPTKYIACDASHFMPADGLIYSGSIASLSLSLTTACRNARIIEPSKI